MLKPPKTVLIVEDDGDVRAVATAVLEDTGFRVLEAASGDEAYCLLSAHPEWAVDVLFTDIVMPGGLDGVDLAKAIRRLRPEVAVLYATGFANLVRDNRESDLQGPILRKPYRPAELRSAIWTVLDGVA